MDSSEQKVVGFPPPAVEAGRPCCVECRTTATPMWRGGPTGPRSLCNACGIRYRKKRRQELGLDNKKPQQQPPQQPQQLQDHSEATSAVKDSSSSKSSSLQVVKKRRVLMGVEEAAILLMAMSSSSRPTLLHG
ncbi:GATA transcription factor 23-like [Phragmites australis]|uniref:GATA transcription factor 23-like n=1 Tax=Phragmites australis TaxID=29695 RepID=UPI002D772D2E|nr:GATA transcription factor 23-like [Phragmites australis]